LNALNAAARHWLDTVANTRIHGETHKQPLELFALEKRSLSALPSLPADTGVTRTVPANNRFRVVLDTNRYSVPSRYASQRLLLKTFADRLCIYHDQELVATHPRSYDRYKDFEDPAPVTRFSTKACCAATFQRSVNGLGMRPFTEKRRALRYEDRLRNGCSP
jgi:hypothetical protein